MEHFTFLFIRSAFHGQFKFAVTNIIILISLFDFIHHFILLIIYYYDYDYDFFFHSDGKPL